MNDEEIYPSWDNTFLGSYKKNVITNNWVDLHNNYKMLRFTNETYNFTARYQTVNPYFSGMVEHIKKYLNLPYTPFHLVTISNQAYILFRVGDEQLLSEFLKNNKHVPKNIHLQMSHWLIFRESLGLNNMRESNFVVRTTPLKMEVITLDDSRCIWEKDGTILTHIPKKMLERWLDYKDIITLYPHSNYSEFVYQFSKQLEQIIMIYNPEYLWYHKAIIDMIGQQLSKS